MKIITNRNDRSAFSLTELIIVVASVAIIGAVAIAIITNHRHALEYSKLEQDVASLNSAVKVYISNGGSLDGITTAQEVIDELKKSADASGQRQVVGIRGSLVDVRLVADEETSAEHRPRARWDEASGKFAIETSTDGVREFRLEEALASVDPGSAPRATSLAYNGSDGWVWESTDYQQASQSGPVGVPTTNTVTLGVDDGGGVSNTMKLGKPIIHPGSGTLDLVAFPLQVTITPQPSDPPDVSVFYSVVANVWSVYNAPITVEPGTSIQAFASSENPSWEDSDPAVATFNNDPVALELALTIPKNPITYAEAGGALEPGDYTPIQVVGPIVVSLLNGSAIPDAYENSDNFQVYWTYDGSDPRSSAGQQGGTTFSYGYPGDSIDYSLAKWEGAALLPMNVIAQSSNPSVVTNSPLISADIDISRTDLRATVISFEQETSPGDPVELALDVDFGDMPLGARIYYTTDGTDPGDDGNGNPVYGTLYTGPFDPLLIAGGATDATIVTRVYPPQEYAAWFEVSPPSSADYGVQVWEISGDASGMFSNPGLAGGMVSSLSGTESSSYFQWGDPGSWGTGANWLDFAGTSFTDVSANERFLVGQLAYYNGTISLSSLATSVDFAVQLAFGGETLQFDYAFDLLTTPNTGTAWENADYVWFNDTASSQTVSLYGNDYSLNLEFGETSEYGFSSIDQFHVQEAQSASANLYATLVSIGSWW